MQTLTRKLWSERVSHSFLGRLIIDFLSSGWNIFDFVVVAIGVLSVLKAGGRGRERLRRAAAIRCYSCHEFCPGHSRQHDN